MGFKLSSTKEPYLCKNILTQPSAKNYVCSDIHGMWGSYKNAIGKLKPQDYLWVLGDCTDRGKYGIAIISDIMKRQQENNPQVTYVLGNHDWWLIQAIEIMQKNNITTDEELQNIISNVALEKKDELFLYMYAKYNGGIRTMTDFLKLPESYQKQIYEFLTNSSIFISKRIRNKNIAFTHAGPVPSKQKNARYLNIKYNEVDQMSSIKFLEQNEEQARKNIQKWKKAGFTTISGHFPQKGKIFCEEGWIKIDVGCANKDALALYCIEDGKTIYFNAQEKYCEIENNR